MIYKLNKCYPYLVLPYQKLVSSALTTILLKTFAAREILVRKEMNSNQVGFWDSKERKGALSQEADEARRIAKETYHKWVLSKEAALRQQSREV